MIKVSLDVGALTVD